MPVSKQRTKDALEVTAKVVTKGITAGAAASAGTGIVATTAAPIVVSLLASAGVATTVPVVGWIYAGVATAVAGTITLVKVLREGKARKGEAIVRAQQAGIPDAVALPGFVTRALNEGGKWRGQWADKLMRKHSKRLKHGKDLDEKDKSKLRVLITLDLLDRAQEKGNEPPPAPAAARIAEYGVAPKTADEEEDWTPVIAGVALLSIAVIGYTTWRSRGKSQN